MTQVKFFKGCLPQILLGPHLNILTHIIGIIFISTFQGFNKIIKDGKILDVNFFMISGLEITYFKIPKRDSTNMKFSMKDFFCKCEQICRKLRLFSHLLIETS